MKPAKLFIIILLISVLLPATVNAEEGRRICSTHLIDSTIDGYRMPNAKGNFDGSFKINKEKGSISIGAEGVSDLHEKIILQSDMKINSITQHDGNYFFEGYAPILTVTEGNAKLELRNVPMELQWNTEDKIVYISYTHQYLEETAITYKETC